MTRMRGLEARRAKDQWCKDVRSEVMYKRGPRLWEVIPDAKGLQGAWPGAWGEQDPESRKRDCQSGVRQAYIKDRDVAVDEFLQHSHLMLPPPICLEYTGCKQQGQVPRAHLV